MLANHPVATFVSDGSSPTLEGSNIHFWELDPVWGFKLSFYSWSNFHSFHDFNIFNSQFVTTPSIPVQSFNRPPSGRQVSSRHRCKAPWVDTPCDASPGDWCNGATPMSWG
jgi:hypothetical protein